MEVGLLWYDADPRRSLADKVGRAAQRYQEKYGRWPNTCFVHPQAVEGEAQKLTCQANGARLEVQVVPAPTTLLHHLWIGEGAGERGGDR